MLHVDNKLFFPAGVAVLSFFEPDPVTGQVLLLCQAHVCGLLGAGGKHHRGLVVRLRMLCIGRKVNSLVREVEEVKAPRLEYSSDNHRFQESPSMPPGYAH